MSCIDLRQQIRTRSFALDEPLRRHVEECELCRTWFEDERLRVALQQEPVPEPSAGFADRAIAQAVQRSGSRPPVRWAAAAALVLAVAAALTAWIGTGPGGWQEPAAFQARVVNVVIDVKDERPEALLTVELTPGLELDGFGDQRRIQWQAHLLKGRNLLALPVNVKPGAGGNIRVALSYGGETRTETQVAIDA